MYGIRSSCSRWQRWRRTLPRVCRWRADPAASSIIFTTTPPCTSPHGSASSGIICLAIDYFGVLHAFAIG